MNLETFKLKEEAELIYSDEKETKKLGCIGHLRGDFGKNGKEFWTTWFPHKCDDMNDQKFKIILDAIIEKLRESGGVLHSRADMYNFCRIHNDEWVLSKPYGCLWGFRLFTQDHAFYFRCTTALGEYNFYVYCYDKNMLLDKLAADRGLPRFCYSYLPTVQELARIDFGESGYLPLGEEYDGLSASELNKGLGITPAQEQALKSGSMYGWNVPAANPKNYDMRGRLLKKKDEREER